MHLHNKYTATYTNAIQHYLALHKFVYILWLAKPGTFMPRDGAMYDFGKVASSCGGKEGRVQLGCLSLRTSAGSPTVASYPSVY